MIKTIIIDDEPYCCESLEAQLQRYCPEINVAGIFNNGADALKFIRQQQPDLVFLDVEMPKMNGFEMLEQLSEIEFNLIFTTSYDKYALKAIRFSALDYLLKPIDREELQKAVEKISQRSQKPITQQLDILMQKIKNPLLSTGRIAMPTMEGLQMIPVDSIVSCESDSNYTMLLLKNKQRLIVSRTLKDIEEMLEEHGFIRVHHSYLVNANEIEKYIRGEGGYLIMSDGSTVDVSRSRKETLLKKLLPGKD
jgi:two-component system LytT family response regulator